MCFCFAFKSFAGIFLSNVLLRPISVLPEYLCIPSSSLSKLWSTLHENCMFISRACRPRGRWVELRWIPLVQFPCPPFPVSYSSYCTRLTCPPLWQTTLTAKVPFRSRVLRLLPPPFPPTRPTWSPAPAACSALPSHQPALWRPTGDPPYSTSRIP